MAESYVLGVDFGSDSTRCIVADTADGRCIAECTVHYPRWRAGKYCDPAVSQYRQHPMDYLEALERAIGGCLSQVPQQVVDRLAGISFDTTASTPVLTDRNGTPLALRPEFAEEPDAMFVLWKDHTALREAAEISARAAEGPVDYTRYCGGSYSCEWVWAKMLHCLRNSPALRREAYSWVEHCDWLCALLVGDTTPERLYRSRCTAGHKAMWHEEWHGLPDPDFLRSVDPLFELFEGHLYNNTVPNGTRVGMLSREWSKRFGINHPIAVGIGAIDCHIGAIGAGIRPGTLVKVIGTSTCDIAVSEPHDSSSRIITGICGQTQDSVLPGHIGYEAGQAAFGDLYAWLGRLLAWAAPEAKDNLLDRLTREAEALPRRDDAPLAVDWFNGRRTPDTNPAARGALSGLTISTSAPELYASLVEATCFGSRAIIEQLRSQHIPVERIVAVGGIAQKSPYVMQTMADVQQLPIEVSGSSQACALGAAICASVAAGIHPDIATAQRAMAAGTEHVYTPDPSLAGFYDRRYRLYRELGSVTEKLDRA